VPLVVCEGAKKAEAIKRWSPYIGMAWCGGCESAGKADWSVLRGRRVLLWPDYDKVGVAAATEIRSLLTAPEVLGLLERRPALIEVERGMFAALERQALKKAQRLDLLGPPAGSSTTAPPAGGVQRRSWSWCESPPGPVDRSPRPSTMAV
jgi:hypothetical protein